MWFCGEVGEGMLGEGYEDPGFWPEPFIAARCDDDKTARSAALAGSKVCSAIVLSCVGCVGELPLVVAPISIFLCEYDRMTPGPGPWPGGGVGAGGEMVGSNVYAAPPLRLGSGCCASLTSRRAGSMSSLRRLKSSVIRRRSCSSKLIRSSRSRSCSTRCLMSFNVAVAYCASASAAANLEHRLVSQAAFRRCKWARVDAYTMVGSDRSRWAHLAPF